jgi:TctA family transporter
VQFHTEFAHKFSWHNLLYRLLGTGVALLVGVLTG